MATFSRYAVLEWSGEMMDGAGEVTAGTGAFAVPATFPITAGEAAGKTTPEELLAASHATCYGIGLRSLIARRGGRARRVTVTATVTAEKGPRGVRIQSSHLSGEIEALEGLDPAELQEVARETRERCTISIVLEGAVAITYDIIARWAPAQVSTLDCMTTRSVPWQTREVNIRTRRARAQH
jgi:lipoyl-dependent peroxiredoxin